MDQDRPADQVPAPGLLSPQQVRFFETFGFLRLPGWFGDEIGEISQAFEAAFEAATPVELEEEVHFDEPRQAVPYFLEYHPRLKELETDPRVLGVVRSLLGDRFEYCQSDGNLLSCDTSWHCDIYDSPLDQYHVKLFFYLDPLEADTGALRVLPGTNHHTGDYAVQLRGDLLSWSQIEPTFGVSPQDIPGYAIANQPGDLIVGNFRTMHATFGGAARRRLFTMNYRQPRSA